MNTKEVFASEGSRWYTPEGVPVNEVVGANRVVRLPTLRDAKKNNYIPSVTTILQIMAKPELEIWKMKEVAKLCGKVSIGEWETEDTYASYMVSAAKEEMGKARDTGSEVHGAIDRFLLSEFPVHDGLSLHVNAAVRALEELGVAGQRMRVETPFCAKGIAGKVDLQGEEEPWIVDWKTTSKPLDDGKCPDWDDYCAQLAAYSSGNYGKYVRCHNVFLSTSIPGNYMIRTWSMAELSRGWDIYFYCRELWQIKNNYRFT